MLETLRIQNYALIDDVEVDFRNGFNVLTGETGAGKSIIVGALNLVLGARASSDVVRAGADRAKIDAIFRLPEVSRHIRRILAEHEIELEGDELLLSRTVTVEKRSRAYVSGSLVPLSVLAALGDELVDLHGQHEHQSLLKTARQLDLLDNFGGTETAAGRVADTVGELRGIERELAELETEDRERERRIEFLRFEVNEIDSAKLEPGEEHEFRSRRKIIENAEKVFELASHSYAALYEGEGNAAVDSVDAALKDLEELAEIDDRFRAIAEQLADVRTTMDEVASEVRGYSEGVEFDPAELENLNERLSLLSDLKRKYGDSEEAILAYRDKGLEELERYDQRDERLAALRSKHDRLRRQAEKAAGELSKNRKAGAKKLDKQVTAALQDLGMKGGRFETQLEPAELSSTGIDKVEFLLTANPGEALKPLKQVASGGEVSRIMLALKAVFAHADTIPTLIFDEIDAGVGGHVAEGRGKLRTLAESHQTICITHIAQIAAVANAHYHVAKSTRNKKTSTTISHIESEARVEELARLLDGSLSDVSIKHAQELLKAS